MSIWLLILVFFVPSGEAKFIYVHEITMASQKLCERAGKHSVNAIYQKQKVEVSYVCIEQKGEGK